MENLKYETLDLDKQKARVLFIQFDEIAREVENLKSPLYNPDFAVYVDYESYKKAYNYVLSQLEHQHNNMKKLFDEAFEKLQKK